MFVENERIKDIRKFLKLSQEEFGSKIGLTKSSISNIEKGVRNVTEQHIKLLSTTYNVNEHWLRNGEGSMFIENDETLIAELVKEYKLDSLDQKIIEHYLQLSESDRKVIKNYMLSLTQSLATQNVDATATNNDDSDIQAELESYRKELEAEKRERTLSVSRKFDEIG